MEMAAKMTAAQEYYVFVPLRGGHLSFRGWWGYSIFRGNQNGHPPPSPEYIDLFSHVALRGESVYRRQSSRAHLLKHGGIIINTLCPRFGGS